jgi:hypothetical protein
VRGVEVVCSEQLMKMQNGKNIQVHVRKIQTSFVSSELISINQMALVNKKYYT